MVLTAEQHLKIALLYEKAAADQLSVPPPQRAAFARKAKWFRMKARISARKEAAADGTGLGEALVRNGHGTGAEHPSPIHGAAHLANGTANFDARLAEGAEADDDDAAKPRYRSITARLKLARAVLG